MTGIRYPLTMSTSTFAFTWECADTVEYMPNPLYTNALGDTPEERARVEARAVAEVVCLSGGPTNYKAFLDELEDVYAGLARAELEYYGWFNRTDGGAFSVLVACTGRRGLRAVLDGDTVTIDSVRAERAAAALVSVLPEYPPAHFHPVSARVEEVQDDHRRGDEVLAPTTRRSPDGRFLYQLFHCNPAALSEIYVARRDRKGRRQATRYPVGYLYIDDGWVLFYTSTDGAYVTAMPATPAAIVRRLHQLRDEL